MVIKIKHCYNLLWKKNVNCLLIAKGLLRLIRIIVFSDTHKCIEPCIQAINNIRDIDMIIHGGDHWSDARELENIFPDISIKYVKGNCDFALAPIEELIEIGGKKIFVTHGHMYNVKQEHERYETIKERGLRLSADVVVFGHTHIPYNENSGKITIINPGSVKYTRNYGIIEIENDKTKTAILNF